jgi:hypothetical protein
MSDAPTSDAPAAERAAPPASAPHHPSQQQTNGQDQLPLPSPRVLIFGLCHESSGVPDGWAATAGAPGVCQTDLSSREVDRIRSAVSAVKRDRGGGVVVVVSIHWGGNWGFAVDLQQQHFAHALIDKGGRVMAVQCDSVCSRLDRRLHYYSTQLASRIPQPQNPSKHAPAPPPAGVDVVHGHSSHHAKGFEVYCGKLVLYGAGDLISDYEGIHVGGST